MNTKVVSSAPRIAPSLDEVRRQEIKHSMEQITAQDVASIRQNKEDEKAKANNIIDKLSEMFAMGVVSSHTGCAIPRIPHNIYNTPGVLHHIQEYLVDQWTASFTCDTGDTHAEEILDTLVITPNASLK